MFDLLFFNAAASYGCGTLSVRTSPSTRLQARSLFSRTVRKVHTISTIDTFARYKKNHFTC